MHFQGFLWFLAVMQHCRQYCDCNGSNVRCSYQINNTTNVLKLITHWLNII